MGNYSLRPVLAGLIFIIVTLVVLSLIVSAVLLFSSVTENAIQWFLLPATLITVMIGGLIAGSKAGHKGWYFGIMTGIGFIILSWLMSFLGFNLSPDMYTLLMYASCLAIAMLGGIIGVNLNPKR
jgi:putative membrane protein (TIGR04086 family)